MATPRYSEVAAMPNKINPTCLYRYLLPETVDHLASSYVIGTLSLRVKNRVELLRTDIKYKALDEKIFYWENKLSLLDQKTSELETKLTKKHTDNINKLLLSE